MVNAKLIGLFLLFAVIIYPIANASAGRLTTGDVDDNLNFDLFLDYLEGMQQSNNGQALPSVQFSDRVTIRILDGNENPVSRAYVKITPENAQSPLIETHAASNGIFRFFPTMDGAGEETRFEITVSAPDGETSAVTVDLDLDDLDSSRSIDVVLKDYQNALPGSLDLMLVIDATGSMGDEMNYLKSEFKTIIKGITQDYPGVSKRFSLIVYRDVGDQYVVRSFDFTDSLDTMQKQLDDQSAAGGGNYPEAMDKAIEAATEQSWRSGNTAKLLFLVADAPPHDGDLDDTLRYMKEARKMGIQIHPLAASGVGDSAEYMMRIGACLTNGRYLFLTDDSGIGNSHAEPHIKGYVVTSLENLFIRVVESKLAGKRVEATDNDVIRTVGTVENGVIVTSDQQQQQQEQLSEEEKRSGSTKFRSRRGGDDDDEHEEDTEVGYNQTANNTGGGDGDEVPEPDGGSDDDDDYTSGDVGDDTDGDPGDGGGEDTGDHGGDGDTGSEIVKEGSGSEEAEGDVGDGDKGSDTTVEMVGGGETEPGVGEDVGGEWAEKDDGASAKFSVGVLEDDDDSSDALSASGGGPIGDKKDSKAVPAFEIGMVLSAIGITVFVVIRKKRR